MNISFFNIITPQQTSFKGKSERNSDMIDAIKKIYPEKQELNETEKKFNEVLLKYNTVTNNAKSQKELLKTYYSSQDRYDYQILMKEKSRLSKQLKRIAEKSNSDSITMEIDIIAKKTYNRYAPKIFKSTTIQQLEELQKLILESPIFLDVKKTLLKIITEYRKILK